MKRLLIRLSAVSAVLVLGVVAIAQTQFQFLKPSSSDDKPAVTMNDVTPERDILVGDTPEAFAAQVLRLLRDPQLGARLAANGRKLVEEKYDYRRACQPLDDVYMRAATARGGTG